MPDFEREEPKSLLYINPISPAPTRKERLGQEDAVLVLTIPGVRLAREEAAANCNPGELISYRNQ